MAPEFHLLSCKPLPSVQKGTWVRDGKEDGYEVDFDALSKAYQKPTSFEPAVC